MKIDIPEKVEFIIKLLEAAGFEAYAVGGCVRDSLLGRKPKDWDITTNAFPEQVKEIFHHTIDTGIEHGTVTVMLNREGFEVTTYRIDGKYEDNRHPSEVLFTRNLADDLLRRDFTINAMAYNPEKGLVDIFNGREDLENRIIRAVGDPVKRFSEDALRIMRAVRFSSVLGFDIEEETGKAMKSLAKNLSGISAERVREELVKLVMGMHPERLFTAYDSGITKVVFPEWDRMTETKMLFCNGEMSYAEYTINTVKILRFITAEEEKGLSFEKEQITDDAENSSILSRFKGENGKTAEWICRNFDSMDSWSEKQKQTLTLAALLHCISGPECVSGETEDEVYKKSAEKAVIILRRLKFDNETIKEVKTIVSHMNDIDKYEWHKNEASARIVAHQMGGEVFPMLMPVLCASVMAGEEEHVSERLAKAAHMRELFDMLVAEKQCFALKQLDITGKDLINLGIKPGPELGRILNELLEEVIRNPQENSYEILTEKVKKMMC